VKLHTDVDALRQGKAKVMRDHEIELAVDKKNRAYRVSHRKKLHDIHVELERVMNDIGARCLPYPTKGNTISEIIAWCTSEIQALPNAIAKVNKISWYTVSLVF
jgi:hypothetical protein